VNIASRVQGLAMTPSILATDSVIDHPQSASLLGNGSQKPVARQHALRGLAGERTVYEIP
jgi:class 3 adenylate cyclase